MSFPKVGWCKLAWHQRSTAIAVHFGETYRTVQATKRLLLSNSDTVAVLCARICACLCNCAQEKDFGSSATMDSLISQFLDQGLADFVV